MTWDALAGWALLPSVCGEVVRVAHRMVMCTPPVAEQEPVAATVNPTATGSSTRASDNAGEEGEQLLPTPDPSTVNVTAPGVMTPGEPGFKEPWQGKLVPALLKVGAFVLDPRFAAAAPICNAAWAAGEIAPQNEDALLIRKLRMTADLGHLRPGAMETREQQVHGMCNACDCQACCSVETSTLLDTVL